MAFILPREMPLLFNHPTTLPKLHVLNIESKMMQMDGNQCQPNIRFLAYNRAFYHICFYTFSSFNILLMSRQFYASVVYHDQCKVINLGAIVNTS